MINVTPDYLAAQGLSPTIVERFWAKVQKTDSCWLWTGSVSQSLKSREKKWFYGMVFARWASDPPRTKTIRAHILSWILHQGPIPVGKHVLHNCPGGDNTLCVNPAHLWLGTHEENMADMKRKGRANGHGPGRLTPNQVRTIRALYRKVPRSELSLRFGICVHQVCQIGSGRGWKSIV